MDKEVFAACFQLQELAALSIPKLCSLAITLNISKYQINHCDISEEDTHHKPPEAMSSNPGNLGEADLVPGAFPSDDAITENEQTTHSSQGPTSTGTGATGDEKLAQKARDFAQQQQVAQTAGGETGNTATSGLGGQGDKAREFHEQQSAAHTAGEQNTDKYTPVSQDQGSRAGAGPHPGQNSGAWTDVSNPDTLPGTAEGKEAPTTGSRLGQTSGTSHQASSAPESGVDTSSIGSGFATAATALGLAAKDAFFAAKDAAVPAASAATEQTKNLAGYTQENAVPAANYVAEQTQNAATYTKDTVASGIPSASQQPGDPTLSSRGAAPSGGAVDTVRRP